MKPWLDNVKSGARWVLLLIISSVWVEAIRDNLWWILFTLLIAGALTGIVAGYRELKRQADE